MSFPWNFHSQGGTTNDDYRSSFSRNNFSNNNRNRRNNYSNRNYRNINDFPGTLWQHNDSFYHVKPENFTHANRNGMGVPSLKRRKFSASTWGGSGRHYVLPGTYDLAPSTCNYVVRPTRHNAEASMSTNFKRDRSQLEDDEPAFMSRDEIERHSPSRKDGIDALREAHLRYSYCTFLQNLGLQLELPQTTIGTAMVLCHRFFVRQSHASHDRFLIATATLFLAAKSEETPRPLNNVLRASCEISRRQDVSFLSHLLPTGWFELYRERVIEAEHRILSTLNFELNVQHPYAPLTSVLDKLGLSQTVLVNLALNLVSEGLRSSLWLQFKSHHIAAGAVFLAAKFLNLDLTSYQNIWQEFQTTPEIIQDVSQQLMELF
ncbi:cyclin-T1-5-like isoform X1 [Juglans microcarpa x Juglans regia]|uniref:cyclin-T1-5-like isoform X1 n=1 Tax=Juglans microcarpa x Juglans regia TaxID=2249226 RepID=UPI001B7E6014|nr:cyclin-T1-5-like isoform X1 [Juglans microcarpa x Juglans regia]